MACMSIEERLELAEGGDREQGLALAELYDDTSHDAGCAHRLHGGFVPCDCVKDRIMAALFALDIDIP